MRILVILFIITLSHRAYSAACCGGGFNIPSIIVGDDGAQFTSTFSQSQITDDVSSVGIWAKRLSRDSTQTLKLEGAKLIAESLQLGLSAPLVRRSTDFSDSNTSIGDISLVAAYEILPELEYTLWKPRGHIFSQIISPTGKSIYESTGADITGKGLWSWGTGFILSKIVYSFDFQFTGEVHKSFDRSISNSSGEFLLIPGWGNSFSLGGGYSYKSFRLGSGISFIQEDSIKTSGAITSQASATQRYATASYQLNYLIDREWAATLAYSDQRLFGTPQNTTLSQSLSLSLQKRWQR